MKGELYINGYDAWEAWGVSMGEGFIEAIDSPSSLKSFIYSESRLENGRRVDVSNPRMASRELTLGFTITGASKEDHRDKKASFLEMLQRGTFDVRIPALGKEVYHLVYSGKSVSYGCSKTGCFSHFNTKVEEPNPANRS